MRRKLSAAFCVSMAVLISSFFVRAQTKTPAYSGPAFEDVARQSGLSGRGWIALDVWLEFVDSVRPNYRVGSERLHGQNLTARGNGRHAVEG